MKGLVITLLIMGLLYLFIFREQAKQMDALSDTAVEVNAETAQPLKPYQQQLDQAKGIEDMLNKGVQDRMRSVDGLD
ncbi:hypothetical protein A9Q88_12425 [Gammaproteobacteria bacterium 50_400_T64]|nr:hypothetical protein A9Q88_12425 [Gammaproteobacteria bacterium 50_400_T64]